MHKTLYIDTDEEITSIVDRVRKADASELIVVAPKNAILLQSIVNLKLLKKEVDRRKKQLLIITQDKVGKKLIEQAGISAQTKPGKDLYLDAEPSERPYEPMYADEAMEIREELQREEANKEVGSSDYFDEKKESIAEPSVEKIETAKNLKKAASPGKRSLKSKVNMSDIVVNQSKAAKKTKKNEPKIKQAEPEIIRISEADPIAESSDEIKAEPPRISQVSIKKAEKFFRGARRKKKDFETARMKGGAKKYFFTFVAVFVLLAVAAVLYFLLPKATIVLATKNQHKPISLEVTANTQAASSTATENLIPATFEQIVTEKTEEFEATGTKDGGAKASGKVVIYNEFSSQEQPLVATTRLETSDGKIFRITKDLVVPGMTKIGNETKPGAIEAEVMADQVGDTYNIEASDFKISGFKGTPSKFEKFYAKSSQPMTGGVAGVAKSVTAQDLASAKDKVASIAKKSVLEELRSQVQGRKIFDDAVLIEVLSVSAPDSAGTTKDNFPVTAKLRVSALSFQEDDVKKILESNPGQWGANPGELSFDSSIDYTLIDFNIGQKTMKFQAKTDIRIAPDLDTENFKKGILGKTAWDAQAYAKTFPIIEKMDISFWPFFMNRVPANEKRVEIQLK